MPQADNDDTQVSEPTETVETSTNEETPDTDVDLESDETSFDDVEDDETEEAEDLGEDALEDTEPAEDEEESKEDEEQSEESEDVADDTDEPKETEESSDKEPSEEDVKRHNAEMAARRIAEKQAKEMEKAQQQDAYLQAAEDARDLALRQLQVDAYNNRVEKNVNSLTNDMERAVSQIDLFKTGTPEVKEELIRRAEDFEQKYIQFDANGDPVNVGGSLFEYLKQEADSIQRILQTGAREQSKAKTKAKARTETLPSRAPKEPKVDPDLAAFDEEVAKWE